uniref:Uncharacterized protein n=1 Tax=Romanomermis culicivorax TaxID=13658 RepID=A0A915J9P9_ROMCU
MSEIGTRSSYLLFNFNRGRIITKSFDKYITRYGQFYFFILLLEIIAHLIQNVRCSDIPEK